MFKIIIDETQVNDVLDWWKEEPCLARWESVNLSNPGAAWITPGNADRPNWQAATKPEVIVTNPDEVGVETRVEVNRFYVAVRHSSTGLYTKLTDGATRRLRSRLAKYPDEQSPAYHFDYETQEAVITIRDDIHPLTEYMETI